AGLTAVVGSLLMMIFGIIEPSDVVAPFGSDTVIMVASVLILGSAVFETGAAEIIGSAIVRRMGRNEKLLIMVLVLTVSILSSFLSNSGGGDIPAAAGLTGPLFGRGDNEEEHLH